MFRVLAVIAIMTCLGAQASAERGKAVSQIRFGVLAHNISVGINPGNDNQESGENVQLELVFRTPSVLSWKYLLSPKPYVIGSVNTAGNTSFGGSGLLWNFPAGKRKRWEFETGIGYVIHNGELDIPFPGEGGNLQNATFDSENILFGSRDLFRSTLAFNRHIGERWGVQMIYEHLSHGQILGSGRNQGSDSVGLRAYYRFGTFS